MFVILLSQYQEKRKKREIYISKSILSGTVTSARLLLTAFVTSLFSSFLRLSENATQSSYPRPSEKPIASSEMTHPHLLTFSCQTWTRHVETTYQFSQCHYAGLNKITAELSSCAIDEKIIQYQLGRLCR